MAAKTLKLAGFGFLLGMVVGVLMVVVGGFADGGDLQLPQRLLAATGSEAGALLAHMLLSGVYGAVPMAGVMFYEIDSWGLLRQAAVHYVSYTLAFLLVGLVVGWIGPDPLEMGIVAAVFLVFHCIIWFVMHSRYKAETAELNELLHEVKR